MNPRSEMPDHLRRDPPPELLDSLPPEVRTSVMVAGNGELLFPLTIAAAAARWVAGRGAAIAGGEVYAPRPPAWGTFVRQWTAPERAGGEPWEAFVQRTLALALEEVAAGTRGEHPGADPEEVRVFFAELHEQA